MAALVSCRCCKRFCKFGAIAAACLAVTLKLALDRFLAWQAVELSGGVCDEATQMTETSVITDFEPLPWDDAHTKAMALLSSMSRHEKQTLLQGRGWVLFNPKKWWYTGNVAPLPHLGIHSLNMQDAGQGVRTHWDEMVGTVTCWPSALAMAATWDPSMVRRFSGAMADEFRAKGINMILGPSVNVHRVARNGRNFEYLSGEDPYLGARLAEAYVAGINSRGLMTSLKHWVFNEQETNRRSEDSIVDDKTAWELYYPPFQAAIDAGVTTVMCSYNKVDGEYACDSRKQLTEVLRQKMGFRGFVQSDWWATQSNAEVALPKGLDQEMPGNDIPGIFRNTSLNYAQETLAGMPEEHVNLAATRILAGMFRMGYVGGTSCVPPCCEQLLRRHTATEENAALARQAAAASIVLLKNEGEVLPFKKEVVRSIAVVGSPAVAQPFNPDGHSQEFGVTGMAWNTGDYYAGGGSGHVTAGYVITPLDGIRRRADAEGIQVLASPTDDAEAALKLAKESDVTLVVAGTTCGEEVDRKDLALDHNADDLIAAVSKVAKQVVVVAAIPGAVLMPWRESVAAIAVLFLGGQETGNAWASVLFGDVPPAGRLPLMIPQTANDTIEPGLEEKVVYTEGLLTSYRNRNFKAAFPFGHGLTYTTFEYGEVRLCTPTSGAEVCLELAVHNSGKALAGTTAQLYLEFPAEAGHPAPILKGFHKTGPLAPEAPINVRLELSRQDVSQYSVAEGAWKAVETFVAHLGESASDIRRRARIRRDPSEGAWVME